MECEDLGCGIQLVVWGEIGIVQREPTIHRGVCIRGEWFTWFDCQERPKPMNLDRAYFADRALMEQHSWVHPPSLIWRDLSGVSKNDADTRKVRQRLRAAQTRFQNKHELNYAKGEGT
jgi:hypothetical protein